jgi:hypothetical protein
LGDGVENGSLRLLGQLVDRESVRGSDARRATGLISGQGLLLIHATIVDRRPAIAPDVSPIDSASIN